MLESKESLRTLSRPSLLRSCLVALTLSSLALTATAAFSANRTAPGVRPVSVAAGGKSPVLVEPLATAAGATFGIPNGLADGGGIWVNMWNYPDVADLEQYCLKLHNNGIRNLFIQTSRSNTDAICAPDKLGPLIETCHRYKIRVIGWSYAELWNPVADADKMVAAARFRSANGEHLDAIAPNLEKNLYNDRVKAYSERIRSQLGPSFPMIAVVYSPLNKAPEVARIPWKTLSMHYDVIAPMAYWNGKHQRLTSYEYTLSTIKQIRQLTGKHDIELHIIGDAMGTRKESILNFLRACRDGAATSASLYPNQKMTEEQTECIAQYFEYFPANSRFRLAAYRELARNGHLDLAVNHDISMPVPRGEFYKLVVKQLHQNKFFGHRQIGEANQLYQLSDVEAARALAAARLIRLPDPQARTDAGLEETLDMPVYGKEALDLVACAVETRERLKNQDFSRGKKIRGASKTVVNWFVQPAFAEPMGQNARPNERPLNYLDAAQIVLEAMAGLK